MNRWGEGETVEKDSECVEGSREKYDFFYSREKYDE
jgi:hypothetical protein